MNCVENSVEGNSKKFIIEFVTIFTKLSDIKLDGDGGNYIK